MAYIVDGPDGLTLIDPEGYVVMMAVSKHNCKLTFEANADRVMYFRNRAVELDKTPNDVVIVVSNVDDKNGRMLADALMPGFDWQSIRDNDQVPFARGLAVREGIQEFLNILDAEASKKLVDFPSEQLAVVVVDHGTCEVF